ncbi:conjugal transfer protein TraK [Erwinia typographi]|uniref:Conjugal transfer protein TraK n=1 Tax=Erwinia typographi TaxID=371042 RepID=A0A0A3YRF9_9GAMM|nr:type-F conjugative transfer system secretin TraK [Erwinia typographi]KGT87916.1 conjugal transfer protein TraK [Erwinia typographi]
MKRKNKACRLTLLAGLLCLGASVLAEPVAVLPVKVPVSPDSQVRVALSNTDPNLLVVPGDRIIAVDSAQGMFLNDNKALGQANGGVQLMTAQTTPFTFYIRTEGGLTVSVIGVPQKRDGRVLQFISGRPVQHDNARRWERSQPYVRTLIAIQQAVLSGGVPEGFTEAPVAAAPVFSLPGCLSVTPLQMWSGGGLRVYRLTVRNRGASSLAVPERLFQARSVRAVMVFPFSTTLMPGTDTQVWVTVSNDGEGEGNANG